MNKFQRWWQKVKDDPERKRRAIEKTRAWRAKNPERAAALDQSVHEKRKLKDPEKLRAQRRGWKKNNRDKCSADWQRWRAAQAVPKWANKSAIFAIYAKAKSLGRDFHVDHIVPLRSKIVCGLHVEHNLQVLPSGANVAKSNRYWPDMPTGR